MKTIVEKSKYLVLIAVASTLVASAAAFIWGGIKTAKLLISIVTSIGADHGIAIVELMDTFLIATVLFIFGMGMYELFIGSLSLPEWLVIKNLHDLKVKLSSVVILVMGIIFLKHLVEWQDPQGTLFFGIGVAVVAAALIAFGHIGAKNE